MIPDRSRFWLLSSFRIGVGSGTYFGIGSGIGIGFDSGIGFASGFYSEIGNGFGSGFYSGFDYGFGSWIEIDCKIGISSEIDSENSIGTGQYRNRLRASSTITNHPSAGWLCSWDVRLTLPRSTIYFLFTHPLILLSSYYWVWLWCTQAGWCDYGVIFPFSSTTIRLVFVLQFLYGVYEETWNKTAFLSSAFLSVKKRSKMLQHTYIYSDVFYIRVYIERGSETVANERWLKHTLMCSFCVCVLVFLFFIRVTLTIHTDETMYKERWPWFGSGVDIWNKTWRKHNVSTECTRCVVSNLAEEWPLGTVSKLIALYSTKRLSSAPTLLYGSTECTMKWHVKLIPVVRLCVYVYIGLGLLLRDIVLWSFHWHFTYSNKHLAETQTIFGWVSFSHLNKSHFAIKKTNHWAYQFLVYDTMFYNGNEHEHVFQ